MNMKGNHDAELLKILQFLVREQVKIKNELEMHRGMLKVLNARTHELKKMMDKRDVK